MSAEQSRLRSAIQRIAKEDPELRGAIDAAKSRGDQPGGVGLGESDGERDRLCCDGSANENINPGTSTRDSEGGTTGLDADDPASLGDIGGCLSSVTDCATGTPVCFCGDDWIPPDGWDGPTSPPIEPDFTEGFYWSALLSDGSTVVTGQTPGQVCSLVAEEFSGSYCFYNLTDEESASCFIENNQGDCSPTRGASRKTCTESIAACDLPPPLEESWPADGCANLAIVNGSIVGSKYDPENDGSYSAPRDEIELCDPENGSRILIRPSSDGGWKSIQSLAGEPDGAVDYGYLYAPDGKRIRQISPSEFRDDMV